MGIILRPIPAANTKQIGKPPVARQRRARE